MQTQITCNLQRYKSNSTEIVTLPSFNLPRAVKEAPDTSALSYFVLTFLV